MAVYFVRAGEGGPVKIGSTNNLRLRLINLQIANYLPLVVSRVIEDAGANQEQWLHRRYLAHLIRAEWFHWQDEMATIVPPPDSMFLAPHIPNAAKAMCEGLFPAEYGLVRPAEMERLREREAA